MAPWLVGLWCGALPMSLPAVNTGKGFSEKYHVYPLSMMGHCIDVVSLGTSHTLLDSGVYEYLVGKR